MASRRPEWYQSGSYVTASVLIKELPTREGIEAKFGPRHCAICVGDEVYWEATLANSIVPENSSLKCSKVRAELKMKKENPIPWTDYEAVHVPSSSGGPQQTCHPMKTKAQSVSKETPAPSSPLPSPASSPSPALKQKQADRKTFKKTVQNDFVYLNHITHDWIDKGEDEVIVKVMVEDVMKETCTVDFKSEQIELLFQSSNERFLSSYTGSSQTMFVWKLQLHDAIKPEMCHYEVTSSGVAITLKKMSAKKWKMLEKSAHSSPSLSNSVANRDPTPSNQNQSSSNLNDFVSETNNFDDLDDVRQPSQESSNSNQTQSTRIHSNYRTPPTPSTTAATATAEPQHKSQVGEPQKNFHTNPLYKAPSNTGSNRQKTQQATYVPPSELEMADPSYREKQLGQPSTTGLMNLGNTCFMNSVLQCLSNTQELRDYFITGRYLANINPDNPLGFEGKLSKCFCTIVRKLWSGEYEYFSPKKLLEIVAKRSKYFSGNSQHDTHEFMSYLIDGLHEDLNRVREKPVTKPVEMEDRPDSEVAAESWRLHKMRNDSMMVDLFQGQFKSTLACQECNKESVTFDPFLSLSVPIPRNLRRLPVIFVPQDPNSTPKQLVLQLPPEATLKLLKASVGRRTSLSMSQLRVFEVYKGKFQSLMSDNNHPISGIKSSDTIIVSEVLSERAVKGSVVEINVVQRVHTAPFPTKCALCGCGGEEGRKLLRCSKCKAVGYCHRDCQERDWAEHKRKCGKSKFFPIGLPFVISLPANQLTYSRLTDYADKFSRRSVTVISRRDEKVSENKEEDFQDTERIQESTESMQTSEDSIQESVESIQESIEDIQETAMYTLTRVNRFVEPVSGAVPLQDKGEVPLVFDEKTVYLALDWRDNPNEDGVIVTPKPAMEYEEDEKAESLSSKSDTVSLTDCLQLFTEPETLSQEEAWYCPRCKEHRPAIKQMSVWRLPRFLVIHLKRFSFHNTVWRSKIGHLVSFPLKGLDMSPYLLGDAAKDISPETPPIYDLYATVNHYGNIYIGHYVATVNPLLTNHKEWLCYDDDKVWPLSADKIQCNETYVLFYRRRDTVA